VTVVAPEEQPMAEIFGQQVSELIRSVHESEGVRFVLGRRVTEVTANAVRLDDKTALEADLVVAGVGVEPQTELAELAMVRCDDGVLVDEMLQTSDPHIWAAGDIARWPDGYSGRRLRVEHWVVAQRQGQTAAKNILGQQIAYRTPPFFWTRQFDLSIALVGDPMGHDEVQVNGDVAAHDATVTLRKRGRVEAVVTINRDRTSLLAEHAPDLRKRDARSCELFSRESERQTRSLE
jgi:apoptosis-inducing factor 3